MWTDRGSSRWAAAREVRRPLLLRQRGRLEWPAWRCPVPRRAFPMALAGERRCLRASTQAASPRIFGAGRWGWEDAAPGTRRASTRPKASGPARAPSLWLAEQRTRPWPLAMTRRPIGGAASAAVLPMVDGGGRGFVGGCDEEALEALEAFVRESARD